MTNVLTGEAITDEQLKSVADLVKVQVHLESELVHLEGQMKQATESLRKIQMELLPSAMQAIGLTSLTTGEVSVEVEDFLSCGIPTQMAIKKDVSKIAKRHECFEWLKDHDGADIIKSEVSCYFTRGQAEEIKKAIMALTGAGLSPVQTDDVHWQTLRAFIREKLQSGEEVPRDLFSIYEGKKAVIKKL